MPGSLRESPVQRPPVVTPTGAGLPPDRWRHRLAWGILASVAVNAALWPIAAQVVRSHVLTPPIPITFRRIILPSLPKPPPEKPPKKIIRHIVRLKRPMVVRRRPIDHRRPIVHHTPVALPKPILIRRPPVTPPRPQRRLMPPAAHQRIATAKGPTAAAHAALPDGHAPVGVPTDHQNSGEGHEMLLPPMPQSTPTPQPLPMPTPAPPVHQAPPPPPVVPKPTPPPPSTAVGPTRDAQPKYQTLPEIPEALKSGGYQSYVRVRVDIATGGNFSVRLVTSSGNEDIDRRVLDALKRWEWKPALQNGQPVPSTARFRFDFEVQ